MQARFLIGLFSLLLLPTLGAAHAVHGRLEAGAVGVRFEYDGGAPLRGAEVTATPRGADASVAIHGMTDAQGRFAFFPLSSGEWKIMGNDGMGHRASLVVDVDADGLQAIVDSHSHGHHVSPWIVGFSTLFGLFGLWTLWSHRRLSASGKT